MTKEKKTGTFEWAPGLDNCILGCSNDCLYCFAKQNAVRFHRETEETWPVEHRNLKAKAKKHKGRVMFPTSHDLHIEHVNWWGPHLLKLLEKGNDVLFVTKAQMASIEWICDNLSKYQDQFEIRFTIGAGDEKVREYWEPGAPSINERIEALDMAYTLGFRVSVSMEPCLMPEPEKFIACFPGDYEIWIGMMNHYSFNPDIPEEAYQAEIQGKRNMQRIYEATKDNPRVRYKDTLRVLLGLV